MNIVRIVLSEGSRVWDPAKRQLLVPGQEYEFPATQYWLRRIADGSVKECQQCAQPAQMLAASAKPRGRQAKKQEPKEEISQEKAAQEAN